MRPPTSVQIPDSFGDSCLVTINVKIIPVMILVKPTAKEINPEYVTLILFILISILDRKAIGLNVKDFLKYEFLIFFTIICYSIQSGHYCQFR